MRIAVCDDDEDFRSLLEMVIREDSELELVATARALQPLLNSLHAVDVEGVLLDWLMPDTDQEDAVRRLRAELPRARILILSAVVRGSAEARALAAGADGYVEKGPGARELVARCKQLLLSPA